MPKIEIKCPKCKIKFWEATPENLLDPIIPKWGIKSKLYSLQKDEFLSNNSNTIQGEEPLFLIKHDIELAFRSDSPKETLISQSISNEENLYYSKCPSCKYELAYRI